MIGISVQKSILDAFKELEFFCRNAEKSFLQKANDNRAE
jgi:hypothetical protein